MKQIRFARLVAFCCTVSLLLSGCAAFRIRVGEADPDDTKPLGAKYDFRDLRTLAQQVSDDLLGHPFLGPHPKPPILVPMGLQNRTKTHIDMKALSDTISTHMLRSGKVQFVNKSRRDDLLNEQGYQLDNCTHDTRVAVGKQLGAKYMLTGSLVEIERESGRQVRVSKKQDVYYQLTVEVTDLETGLIAARMQKERLRRASKPLFGW